MSRQQACAILRVIIEKPRTVAQLAEEARVSKDAARAWLYDLQAIKLVRPRRVVPKEDEHSPGMPPIEWEWVK